MHSQLNQVKHLVLLLYNMLACWPWPDCLFAVVERLGHSYYCVKIHYQMHVGHCRKGGSQVALEVTNAKGLNCCIVIPRC